MSHNKFPEQGTLAMTEVLCPSQLAGPKDSDFPEPSVEWFLPQSVRLSRSAGMGNDELGFERKTDLFVP